jgi:hypothetical protein
LEQHLFGVNVGQPSSPDGIIALWRDSPSDRSALKARIAEQLRNWICVHFVHPQLPAPSPVTRTLQAAMRLPRRQAAP